MQETIKLSGEWSYRTDKNDLGEKNRFFDPSFDVTLWDKMEVPSNWEVAGLKDYSGVVWFRKEFKRGPGIGERGSGKQYIIKFNGVDYYAGVWLNGKKLGSHEGYFQPFEFNVTNILKDGENVLVVKVNSPKEGENWPLRKRLIKGVFGHHDLRPGAWNKKLGQTHGTGGIWNSVKLIVTDRVRVKGVKVNLGARGQGLGVREGKIQISAEIENLMGKPVNDLVEITIRESGKLKVVSSKEKRVKIKKGSNSVKFELKIKKPKLWWSWDHGEPHLYEVEVDVKGLGVRGQGIGDSKKIKFGIREIKKDKDGAWVLNGRKIFIRGSNVIPEEYLSTYNKERIAQDIKIIKEANLNAVRVHAHINRKEFYDACDEAGILVWQDFALQWEYEKSKQLYDEARRQIKDMVSLLYNHPSIVAWCCHNEPTVNRETLDPLLFKEVMKLDNSRIIFLSSNFAEHPYPGWFTGKYEFFSSLPGKPFVTEFGAQALPSIETLRKMFRQDELWPPKWDVWAYRDFTYEQYFNIAGQGTGNSIEDFVRISQDYQSRLLKFAIEVYRRNSFTQIFGLFHFLLLEPWPCISYSVVDYFRNKKPGFETLKTALQPVLMIYVPERKILGIGDKIRGTFFLVNDLNRKFRGARVNIRFEKEDKAFEIASFTLDIAESSCKEVTNNVYSLSNSLLIPDGMQEGEYRLVLEILDDDKVLISRNFYPIELRAIPAGLLEFGAVF